MSEMSTPAKSVLMAAATLMIGFNTLAAGRNDSAPGSRTTARGDSSLAYSALAYITWPADAFEKDDSPFVIGVLGKPNSRHEKVLAHYVDGKKQIHGRIVDVQRLADDADMTKCHVLLVAESCSQEQTALALKTAHGRSVLTVGETGEFTKAGGVVGIVRSGNQSILQLNQAAAKRQKLKIDVRLVNLSVLVEEPKSDTESGTPTPQS